MEERSIGVERTARYYILGSPGTAVRRLWIVLHGYGQLAAPMLRRCAALAADDTLVAAPEALSRFYLAAAASPEQHGEARVGASWMTREARASEIADQVAYLDRLHAELLRECGRAALETHVLGFSQGVAAAVRWAVLGATPPPVRLVCWAGNLPPEIWADAARVRLAHTELVLAAGDADPYIPPGELERTVERARGQGFRARAFSFAGGHELHPDALAAALAGGRSQG
jgi:predicted esterase